jgi:hypothetical protein
MANASASFLFRTKSRTEELALLRLHVEVAKKVVELRGAMLEGLEPRLEIVLREETHGLFHEALLLQRTRRTQLEEHHKPRCPGGVCIGGRRRTLKERNRAANPRVHDHGVQHPELDRLCPQLRVEIRGWGVIAPEHDVQVLVHSLCHRHLFRVRHCQQLALDEVLTRGPTFAISVCVALGQRPPLKVVVDDLGYARQRRFICLLDLLRVPVPDDANTKGEVFTPFALPTNARNNLASATIHSREQML